MNINKTDLKMNGSLKWGNYPVIIILHHPEFNGTIEALNDVMINDGDVMIGYNHYVRKDGSVWEGRNVQAIGANCYGHNATSIGIAFEGNFMTDTMSDAQFNAGVELCKYLMQQYPAITEIGPHFKYYNTDCPGTNFPVDRMISAAMAGGSVTVTTSATQQNDCLKLWDSGDSVKYVQDKLIKLGYDIYGGADGIFGQATFNAVEKFQDDNKLTVDGIVGANTLAAITTKYANINAIDINSVKYLQHELNVQLSAGLTEDNIPGPATLSKCPLVNQGSQGNITKWIQNKLGIVADGVFGYQTLVTVQNFQAKYGLGADGVIGQNTWKALLGL